MKRWSLRNHFRPVTHGQFVDYVTQLKRAAETSFGTECDLHIRVLSKPKQYSTFMDDALQDSLAIINDRLTVIKTDSLAEITAKIWGDAGYVEVIINPYDETRAPFSAMAYAEFKGKRPDQATFLIQPAGEDVKQSMLERYKAKIVGSGYEGNGSRCVSLPGSFQREALRL